MYSIFSLMLLLTCVETAILYLPIVIGKKRRERREKYLRLVGKNRLLMILDLLFSFLSLVIIAVLKFLDDAGRIMQFKAMLIWLLIPYVIWWVCTVLLHKIAGYKIIQSKNNIDGNTENTK